MKFICPVCRGGAFKLSCNKAINLSGNFENTILDRVYNSVDWKITCSFCNYQWKFDSIGKVEEFLNNCYKNN